MKLYRLSIMKRQYGYIIATFALALLVALIFGFGYRFGPTNTVALSQGCMLYSIAPGICIDNCTSIVPCSSACDRKWSFDKSSQLCIEYGSYSRNYLGGMLPICIGGLILIIVSALCVEVYRKKEKHIDDIENV
jgi:hypothetical protein